MRTTSISGHRLFLAAMSAVCLLTTGCNEDKLKSELAVAEQKAATLTGRAVAPAQPVRVRASHPSASGGAVTTSYVGRVEPTRETIVTAPHSGTLLTLPIREGMTVAEGQSLAAIGSENVQATFDIATASLRQAQDGYERAQAAYSGGSITPLKMKEVETQLAKAQASEHAARHALEACSVKAPFRGVVSDVLAEQGTEVNAFCPLCRLVDIATLEVHFAIPENEVRHVTVGDTAWVTVGALGETCSGVVTAKGVTASELSHSYDCTLALTDALSELLPGMVCKVRLLGNFAKGLLVPAAAVMTDNQGRYVWVADTADTVQKRYVTIGGFAGRAVAVTDGLAPDDRVVGEGSRKVSSGMKVEVLMEEE